MIRKNDFVEVMRKLYQAYDRRPDPGQVDTYYEKLRGNEQTDLPIVYQMLTRRCRQFPRLPDMIDCFQELKSTRSPGTAPPDYAGDPPPNHEFRAAVNEARKLLLAGKMTQQQFKDRLMELQKQNQTGSEQSVRKN